MAMELSPDDEGHMLQENKGTIHQAIGEGLAQLDEGQGIAGELSRAQLQEKKAAWIDAHTTLLIGGYIVYSYLVAQISEDSYRSRSDG